MMSYSKLISTNPFKTIDNVKYKRYNKYIDLIL